MIPRQRLGRALLALVALISAPFPRVRAACSAPANRIEAENCLPGNDASEWDTANPTYSVVDPDGKVLSTDELAGFTNELSYAPGETVRFKVNATRATTVRLDIFRLGWYGGKGARKYGSLTVAGVKQPACIFQSRTELMDCGNWTESGAWTIPADTLSGIFIVRMTGDNNDQNQMVFVVRNDESRAPIVLMTVDTTWQAYNHYHGFSLYKPRNSRAYKVSYNRPFIIRLDKKIGDTSNSSVFDHEYPLIRWLEKNGYDLTYFTHVDANRRGELLKNHRMILMSGHDEYYSLAEREAVLSARDAGVHGMYLTGNEVYWKTRWEASVDGNKTPFRTLVTYKEEATRAPTDPLDPPIWTGLWANPPSRTTDVGRGRSASEITGQSSYHGPEPEQNYPMRVRAEDGRMRFWRNTSVASLAPGSEATFPELIGYEWDGDFDNGFRNLATWRLSYTPISEHFLYKGRMWNFDGLHTMTNYRHRNGALVFGAGTMQWSWGLDAYHNQGSRLPPQHDIEQATVNILADMGIQPGSLQSGLTPASESSDKIAPTCTVTGPASVQAGVKVTITGTAADTGGGVVGGVVVSINGGRTYRRAEGRENWSWTGTPTADGTTKCLAVDDSGNLTGRVPVTPPPPPPSGGGGQPPAGTSNPAPALNQLEPSVTRPGTPTFTMFVQGNNFVPASVVYWDGNPLTTAFVSNSRLRATVPSDYVTHELTASVTVMTPSPGGGTTAGVPFVVSETAPPGGSPRAYPNPWKANANPPAFVTFDQLKSGTDIKLFTLSGHWIRTLDAGAGAATWDLKNDAGQPVASGYYFYTVKDVDGKDVRGKLAIVR